MEIVTIKPLQKEHWEQVKQIYESGNRHCHSSDKMKSAEKVT